MSKAPRRIRIVVAVVVFIIMALGFAGKLPLLPQLGPAILRLIATGALTAAAWVFGFVALTFLFGRFYCAVLCPLGMLQDFIVWLSRRKGATRKNLPLLRYTILVSTTGLLAAGSVIGAKLIEPFSLFGRFYAGLVLPVLAKTGRKHGLWIIDGDYGSTSAGLAAGAVVLIVLIGLVLWKNRLFCTSICPVGTLLGLLAKFGLFKLEVDPTSCVHCGACAKVCPAGCLDGKTGALDNERCLRCLNCLAACPRHSIRWSRKPHPASANTALSSSEAADKPRRRFLVGLAATLLASWGLGRLAKPHGLAKIPTQPGIYPPGAGSPERFASKCTACFLCVANCKGNVLHTPDSTNPLVHLDYKSGMCEFNCNNCSQICPTGAIRPLTLEKKKRCRIGLAVLHKTRCIAIVEGIHCGACAEQCPTGALRMVDEAGFPCPIPKLNEDLCIGCGNCSYPCPVQPIPAMTIATVPIQTEAADPAQVFDKPPAASPTQSGDWII